MGKVIIASDSFKGSLSSLDVAQAVREGLPVGCPCEVLSVSDGGEGFCAAVPPSPKPTSKPPSSPISPAF